MSEEPASGSGAERLAELRASAKGWHGVQMAVLGFIGLCGVLQRDGDENPSWLELWALLLPVAALLTALWAIVLVGRAAWPLYGPAPEYPADSGYEVRLRRTSRQLSRGLALTSSPSPCSRSGRGRHGGRRSRPRATSSCARARDRRFAGSSPPAGPTASCASSRDARRSGSRWHRSARCAPSTATDAICATRSAVCAAITRRRDGPLGQTPEERSDRGRMNALAAARISDGFLPWSNGLGKG